MPRGGAAGTSRVQAREGRGGGVHANFGVLLDHDIRDADTKPAQSVPKSSVLARRGFYDLN